MDSSAAPDTFVGKAGNPAGSTKVRAGTKTNGVGLGDADWVDVLLAVRVGVQLAVGVHDPVVVALGDK